MREELELLAIGVAKRVDEDMDPVEKMGLEDDEETDKKKTDEDEEDEDEEDEEEDDDEEFDDDTK